MINQTGVNSSHGHHDELLIHSEDLPNETLYTNKLKRFVPPGEFLDVRSPYKGQLGLHPIMVPTPLLSEEDIRYSPSPGPRLDDAIVLSENVAHFEMALKRLTKEAANIATITHPTLRTLGTIYRDEEMPPALLGSFKSLRDAQAWLNRQKLDLFPTPIHGITRPSSAKPLPIPPDFEKRTSFAPGGRRFLNSVYGTTTATIGDYYDVEDLERESGRRRINPLNHPQLAIFKLRVSTKPPPAEWFTKPTWTPIVVYARRSGSEALDIDDFDNNNTSVSYGDYGEKIIPGALKRKRDVKYGDISKGLDQTVYKTKEEKL